MQSPLARCRWLPGPTKRTLISQNENEFTGLNFELREEIQGVR